MVNVGIRFAHLFIKLMRLVLLSYWVTWKCRKRKNRRICSLPKDFKDLNDFKVFKKFVMHSSYSDCVLHSRRRSMEAGLI